LKTNDESELNPAVITNIFERRLNKVSGCEKFFSSYLRKLSLKKCYRYQTPDFTIKLLGEFVEGKLFIADGSASQIISQCNKFVDYLDSVDQ
jgi:hypothetical protein